MKTEIPVNNRDDDAFRAYAEQVMAQPKNYLLSARFLTHSMEKCVARYNVLPNRGLGKAADLITELEDFRELVLVHTYEYQEGLAALEAFLAFQEEAGGDVAELRERAAGLLATAEPGHAGGCFVATRDELLAGTRFDFPAFAASRHSMRTYACEDVTEEEFLDAVRLAELCPSACNREPWKVYYSLDRDVCRKLADVLPAQPFLRDAYVGVITIDRGLFANEEILQWFVNGGIFAAYLVQALHYKGIGSCLCEINVLHKDKPLIRELMGIPEAEEIICFVGFGKYPEEAKCTCAERKPVSDVAIRVG